MGVGTMTEHERTESEEFLTVDAIAEKLIVHPDTVRRWIRTGKLPAVRIGTKSLRVRRTVFNDFLIEQETTNGESEEED